MAVTRTFGFTGGWQTYTIPAGITSCTITMDGAGSGSRAGARVTGTLAVSGGQVLYIVIGEAGNGPSGNAGGPNSFGAGGRGGTGDNASGGWSGGGYSGIRLGSQTGTIKAIAGGAGGDSGDAGAGGRGGDGDGGRGNAGSGAATGGKNGSSGVGGAGGTSSSGSEFSGTAGAASTGIAGYGGNTGGYSGPGGGGGGGGYGAGGGGAGGSSGYAPGTGGGGGGSYISGLSGGTHSAGGGGTGNGSLTITHADPNSSPNVPVINSPTVGQRTLSTGSFTFNAKVSDPNGNNVRALFRLASTPSFSPHTDYHSGYVASGANATLTISGLAPNTHYYLNCYAQDPNGLYSTTFDSADFYTNYAPLAPTEVVPVAGASYLTNSTAVVSAVVNDPDGGNVRALFRVSKDNFTNYTDFYSPYVASGQRASATLTGLDRDTNYKVYVYAQDLQNALSALTATNFWTNRTPTDATIISPANNEIFDSTNAKTFIWSFNDPDPADTQSQGLIRYRVAGTSTWTVSNLTGLAEQITIPANTFTPYVAYEWQIQTTDSNGLVGGWSASSHFSASPGQISIAVSAGMNLGIVAQTEFSSHLMQAQAKMITQGFDLSSRTTAMAAIAMMNANAMAVIKMALALSAKGEMTLAQTQQLPYPLNLIATAKLIQSGKQTIDSTQLAITVAAAFAVQVSLGMTPMSAIATMNVLSGSLVLRPELLMAAEATLDIAGRSTSTFNLAFAAQAAMVDLGLVTRTLPLAMVAQGALDASGGLLERSGVQIAVRANMALAGFSASSASFAMAAVAKMVQSGRLREDAAVHFIANAGLLISTSGNLGFAIVPMEAVAELSLIVDNDIDSDGPIEMVAIAALTLKDEQVVYEGAYLVVPGVNNSTMSFTASSYPNPRTVRNTPIVVNVGNVR